MPSILIVDDERSVADAYGAFFERGGHSVWRAENGEQAIALFRDIQPDLVVLDLRLPDMTGFDVYERIRAANPLVIMITGHGDVSLAVRALQEGVENFLTKPVELSHLAVATERALEKVRLRQLNAYLASRREPGNRLPLGSSPVMKDLAAQIELLAGSEKTTVLLLGEGGTGKGRVAELIHAHSPRATGPFVEVNCAALSAEALDAELFGAERPTAAPDELLRTGLLEVADGGTLFLDEIGALPAQLQPKILRVLEGRSFRRPGGTREIAVDVRIVAATNRDLVNEVNAERLREDLYYRLSVMPVYLPPLRARSREDLVELIGHLIDELVPHLPAAPRVVTDDALDRLLRYSWPGNIRELRNVIERAMIVGRLGERIELAHLPAEVREASGPTAAERHVARTLQDVERTHIDRTLRAHDGNRTHAARELGISRATLIKKIKDFGFTTPSR